MIIDIVTGVLVLVISTFCLWKLIRPNLKRKLKPDLSPNLKRKLKPDLSPSSGPNPSEGQKMPNVQETAHWQRSIISCKCAYNYQEILQLLTRQEQGFHDFEQYQLSRELDIHGVKMRYFIARARSKEIFISIAVTGIKNIVAKDKTFCEHQESLFEGRVSSIIFDLASKIPYVHLLEELKDKKLIISGHYIGGAVAQLVTVLMRCHMRRKKQTNEETTCTTLRCITFGAPHFGDDAFIGFTQGTQDDVLLENVVMNGDGGWLEKMIPKHNGVFDKVVHVAQAYGDTSLPRAKEVKDVTKVISAAEKIFESGESTSSNSTPVRLGQVYPLGKLTSIGKDEVRTKKSIEAYGNSFNNYFHGDLQKFDPTDVEPENIVGHQLQPDLDAEYRNKSILQLKVSGRGFDVLDLDTFTYTDSEPRNVKVIKATKTETELTLEISFPVDPFIHIQLPVHFACETHFGENLELPYAGQDLLNACPCMTPDGKADVVEVLNKATKRETLSARYFNASEDDYYKNSKVTKLIGKVTEVTTKKPDRLLKETVRQPNSEIAREVRQIDETKLLLEIREKIENIKIRCNRTDKEINNGVLCFLMAVVGTVGAVVAPPLIVPSALGYGLAYIYLTTGKTKVEHRYRSVLTSIMTLLLNMNSTITSQDCNCKLEKTIQEEAISKECIDEDMLSIDEAKIKKLAVQEITDDTRIELSKRLHAICIIRRVREIYLKEIIILVIGQQNHGKTTLVHQLAGTTTPSAKIGMCRHTEEPILYRCTLDQEEIKLVDMPGSTSTIKPIAALTDDFGKAADLFIWVYQFSGTADQVFIHELEHVKSLNGPFLLCFSKCSSVADDPGMKNGGSIQDMLPKLTDVGDDQVIPIELLEKRQKELKDQGITDVKSADDVREWILEWKRRYQSNQI